MFYYDQLINKPQVEGLENISQYPSCYRFKDYRHKMDPKDQYPVKF